MSEFTDKIDELVVHLETISAGLAYAEKRIAELETAIEPFAKAADQRQVMCDNSERVTWSAITVGDLRRARSALPPKITGGE